MRKKVIFSMGFAGVLAFSTALSALAAPFDAEYYAEQNPDVAAAAPTTPIPIPAVSPRRMNQARMKSRNQQFNLRM